MIDPWVWTLISAELLFVIVRSADLVTIAKSKRQRLPREQTRIARGLHRALALEFLLFVPVSATLLLLVAPSLLPKLLSRPPAVADYALLGIASYGFPFAAVRSFVSRIALNTLKEFATLAPPEARTEKE